MAKKDILFIINPISGGQDKRGFPAVAERFLDKNIFNARFEFTQKAQHAFELASDAVSQGVEIVVAVGGDGTINEVASALVGTLSIMGIIPCGSGNGLARSLNISLKAENAVKTLNQLNVDTIDTAQLAGGKFFNMGGIGFDAQISYMFATMPKRGFKGYIRTTFSEILSYRSQLYHIEIDGVKIEREAFMISLANSSQYGNNAHIAPTASLKDGLLDVCIVKPFPLRMFPVMVYHLFNRTSERSKYVEIIKGKKIHIKSDRPEVIHLDGEPKVVTEDITAFINPLSLKILH